MSVITGDTNGGGGIGGGSSGLSRTRMAVYSLVFSDHVARTLREYATLPPGLTQLLPPWLVSTLHLKHSGGGGGGVSQMSPSLQRFLLSLGPAVLAILGGSSSSDVRPRSQHGGSGGGTGGKSPGDSKSIAVMEVENMPVNSIQQGAGREGGADTERGGTVVNNTAQESLASGRDDESNKEQSQGQGQGQRQGQGQGQEGSSGDTSAKVVTALVREEVSNNNNNNSNNNTAVLPHTMPTTPGVVAGNAYRTILTQPKD